MTPSSASIGSRRSTHHDEHGPQNQCASSGPAVCTLRRHPFRKMRVMVDLNYSRPRPRGKPDAARCRRSFWSTNSYEPSGTQRRPPSGLEPAPIEPSRATAVVRPPSRTLLDRRSSPRHPDSCTRAGVQWETRRRSLRRTSARHLRQHGAAVLLSDAYGCRSRPRSRPRRWAPICTSQRPYLHAATSDIARGVTVCRPEKPSKHSGSTSCPACSDGRNYHFNRGLLLLRSARKKLRPSWRSFGACVPAFRPTRR